MSIIQRVKIIQLKKLLVYINTNVLEIIHWSYTFSDLLIIAEKQSVTHAAVPSSSNKASTIVVNASMINAVSVIRCTNLYNYLLICGLILIFILILELFQILNPKFHKRNSFLWGMVDLLEHNLKVKLDRIFRNKTIIKIIKTFGITQNTLLYKTQF